MWSAGGDGDIFSFPFDPVFFPSLLLLFNPALIKQLMLPPLKSVSVLQSWLLNKRGDNGGFEGYVGASDGKKSQVKELNAPQVGVLGGGVSFAEM